MSKVQLSMFNIVKIAKTLDTTLTLVLLTLFKFYFFLPFHYQLYLV